MQSALEILEVLIYYDAPQLFIARDTFMGRYICMLVKQDERTDSYLCTSISSSRLGKLKAKDIDLLTVYSSPEIEGQACMIATYKEGDLLLNTNPLRKVPDNYLPEADLYIELENTELQERVAQDAAQKKRAICHLHLDPPESREEPRIKSETLSSVLLALQTIVKHAYKKAISEIDKKSKELISSTEFSQLDVYAFSAGSFTIHLQSANKADLSDYVDIERAFLKIDELCNYIGNTEEAMRIVKENRGHLANAFIRFLELVVFTDTSISISWATPRSRVHRTNVLRKEAEMLYAALSNIEDLGVEDVAFTGVVTQVDTIKGTWTILNEEDETRYGGSLEENTGISLAGIVVDKKRYRFECVEQIESVAGTGKEKTTYRLKAIKIP